MGLILGASGLAIADEDESSLSAEAGYAGFSIPDHSAHGGMLGLDYERGVTDVLWLRASAGGGGFYDLDASAPAYAGFALLGISYQLDVLRYVPRVELGLGGIYIHGEEIEEPLQPLVQIGVGLDVLTSRSRSYGVFMRFESFLSRSAFFTLGGRLSWRWGFF